MALAVCGWKVLAAPPRKSGGVPESPRRRRPHAASETPAARGSRLTRELIGASLKHSTRGPQKPPGYFTGCPKVPGRFARLRTCPGPLASWYASIEKSLALTLEAPGHDRQCSALSHRQACRADAGGLPDGGAPRGIRGLGQGVGCGVDRA